MKTLKPQKLHESTYSDMEKQLRDLFYKIIFKPVVDLLAPLNAQAKAAAKELRNAIVAPVVAAINSGKIQYVDNTFSGDFNATLSKALKSYGAKFNKQQGTFTILQQDLPLEVLDAINTYSAAAKDVHDELDKRLKEIERGLGKTVDDNLVDATLVVGKMEKGFNKAYGEAIGEEELSDRAKKDLASDYSNNMKLWIKKWSEDTIKELRGAVADNAATGYRFDRLVDRIQNRYDVSKTKSEFLARQETALFVSKHRQQRFEDVGITSYIWRTAGDTNVREDHAHLNGKTFSYDNPPVVDVATGRRANAGEDFNCLPGDSPINFADGVRKGVVRYYSDWMTEFVTVSGRTVRLTPNHQVLTSAGWKEAKFLNEGDDVVNLSKELDGISELNIDHRIPTISEIVKSLNHPPAPSVNVGDMSIVNFYSDLTDRHVYIVRPAWSLMTWIKSECLKSFEYLILSFSYLLSSTVRDSECILIPSGLGQVPHSSVRPLSEFLSFFKGGVLHSKKHTFTSSSDRNPPANEGVAKSSTRNMSSFLNGKKTLSIFIRVYQWSRIKSKFVPSSSALIQRISDAVLLKNPTQAINRTAEVLGNEPTRHFSPSHFDRIANVRRFKFSGHVYNLETKNNWYCSDSIILHNCRCVAEPILPGVLTDA